MTETLRERIMRAFTKGVSDLSHRSKGCGANLKLTLQPLPGDGQSSSDYARIIQTVSNINFFCPEA